MIVLAGGCVTNTSSPKPAPDALAYQWLCAQQGAHGILGNQDGEYTAWNLPCTSAV